jgi:uncharacterized protein DUF4282
MTAETPMPTARKAGFFDISFTKFLSLSLIKVLWVVSIILIVLATVAGIVYGISLLGDEGGTLTDEETGLVTEDPDLTGRGVLILVLSPIWAAIQLILTRIFLELLAVVFRIESNTRPRT